MVEHETRIDSRRMGTATLATGFNVRTVVGTRTILKSTLLIELLFLNTASDLLRLIFLQGIVLNEERLD